MHQPANGKHISLVLLIPITLVVSFAIINYAFMMQGKPINLIGPIEKFGFDFRDFHWAGKYLLEGKNPYSWERFVTPPLSACFAALLADFSPKTAIVIFFWVNLLVLTIGLTLLNLSFALAGERQKISLFSLAVTALFSYPVFFLLQRGNIDGLVLFFMALGIYASSRAPAWWSDVFAGAAFAVAVHLKIYPLILYLPILAARRWRLAGSFSFFLVLFALFTFRFWIPFFENLLWRQEIYSIKANGSLENTLTFISNYFALQIRADVLSKIAYVIYFALLATLWGVHLYYGRFLQKRNFAMTLIIYIPFMVIIPSTVYHYEFVLALAFIPFILWLQEINTPQTYILSLIGGIILTQFQTASLTYLTGSLFLYSLSGAGMLVILVSSLFVEMKSLPAYDKPAS